jgi:hypothetical protein
MPCRSSAGNISNFDRPKAQCPLPKQIPTEKFPVMKNELVLHWIMELVQ